MKKIIFLILILLISVNAFAAPTHYKRLEPETLAYGGLPSPTIAQFTVNEYVKAVKYASGVTLASTTLNISNPATSPLFLTRSSVDLRWTVGFYITLTDGAAKTLKVLVGTAGSAETLGSVLNVSNCETSGTVPYETFDGVSATGFHAINVGSAGTFYGVAATADEIAYVAGKLYKTTFSMAKASGIFPGTAYNKAMASTFTPDTGSVVSTEGANVRYCTVPETATGVFQIWTESGNDTEFTISSLAVTNVTAADATGVTFSSPVVDAGFNYAAASYTTTITRN